MNRSTQVSHRAVLAVVAAWALAGACAVDAQADAQARGVPCPLSDTTCLAPEIAREFRGVWVATVGNMNWPSRAGLPTDSARSELTAILDRAARTGLNAVVFQVRPAGDALYESKIEPWSEYLTGRQGVAPRPLWDPLAFAVREAHARGLELHAWFNPYRAKDPSAHGPLARSHFARRYPAFAREYGRYLWFDPGEPVVRKRTVRVVLDVVRRYDVDGVHMDDYFYPYPEQRRGRDIPFPDARSWRRYRNAGGTLDRDDWRRRNVDLLIDTLRKEVARAKPWVKFGVSPFGIWRPGSPESVRGFDAYSELYADSRKWFSRGWVDYLAPQLYWAIAQDGQPFPDLLKWWGAQNDSSRLLWPGVADYKVGGAAAWKSDEVLAQVAAARAERGVTGLVHFDMTVFMEDRDSLATRLAAGPYHEPALVPEMTWRHVQPPLAPELSVRDGPKGDALAIVRAGAGAVRWWAVQVKEGSAWHTRVLDGDVKVVPLVELASDPLAAADVVSVTAVSRTGVLSAPSAVRIR